MRIAARSRVRLTITNLNSINKRIKWQERAAKQRKGDELEGGRKWIKLRRTGKENGPFFGPGLENYAEMCTIQNQVADYRSSCQSVLMTSICRCRKRALSLWVSNDQIISTMSSITLLLSLDVLWQLISANFSTRRVLFLRKYI